MDVGNHWTAVFKMVQVKAREADGLNRLLLVDLVERARSYGVVCVRAAWAAVDLTEPLHGHFYVSLRLRSFSECFPDPEWTGVPALWSLCVLP